MAEHASRGDGDDDHGVVTVRGDPRVKLRSFNWHVPGAILLGLVFGLPAWTVTAVLKLDLSVLVVLGGAIGGIWVLFVVTDIVGGWYKSVTCYEDRVVERKLFSTRAVRFEDVALAIRPADMPVSLRLVHVDPDAPLPGATLSYLTDVAAVERVVEAHVPPTSERLDAVPEDSALAYVLETLSEPTVVVDEADVAAALDLEPDELLAYTLGKVRPVTGPGDVTPDALEAAHE
jgi:hypothetical protein